MLPGLSGPAAIVKDVLDANESVRDLLEIAARNQLFLKAKMRSALDAFTPARGPAGPTGPTGPMANPPAALHACRKIALSPCGSTPLRGMSSWPAECP